MARRLRLQYPGARYHVINRGNLQHYVFATAGTKDAFLVAMGESAMKFGWRASAFVVMRNHYHLALETPEPNLVAESLICGDDNNHHSGRDYDGCHAAGVRGVGSS